MQRNGSVAYGVLGIALSGALASCGGDLGMCDMTLIDAETAMMKTYSGQSLVNASCAGGTCHALSAQDAARMGAPAGLNFDLVPATTADTAKVAKGQATVREQAEAMWEEIDEGTMPPEGKRAALVASDKETIRNWLACNSPVDNRPPNTMPTTADLTSIYAALTGPTMLCKSCHSAGTDGTFMAGMTACEAHTALVDKPAVGSKCGTSGQKLVVAGQPDQSLLLQKLAGTQTCGDPMPLGGTPVDPMLVQNIRAWITAGALKPAGCP